VFLTQRIFLASGTLLKASNLLAQFIDPKAPRKVILGLHYQTTAN